MITSAVIHYTTIKQNIWILLNLIGIFFYLSTDDNKCDINLFIIFIIIKCLKINLFYNYLIYMYILFMFDLLYLYKTPIDHVFY